MIKKILSGIKNFYYYIYRIKYIIKTSYVKKNDYDFVISKMSMYCHALDKSLKAIPWEPNRSLKNYALAKKMYTEIYLNFFDDIDIRFKWNLDVLNKYEERNDKKSNINYNIVFDVINENSKDSFFANRISRRNYLKEKISPHDLEKICNAAFLAPTSCNRQTLKIYLISEDEKLKQNVLAQFYGFSCFSKYIPCIAIVCVDLRSYMFPKEIFTPFIDAGLGVQNFLLSASKSNIGSNVLTWGASSIKQDKNIRDLLKLPGHYEIICGITLGYSDEKNNFVEKKTTKNNVFHF